MAVRRRAKDRAVLKELNQKKEEETAEKEQQEREKKAEQDAQEIKVRPRKIRVYFRLNKTNKSFLRSPMFEF